ncbi:MAG TPA: ectonucleotide pyrophosphatase/phosphodiesterase [Allosphingosinicella sp.]|nr:ectonucleotide pyrophosphatase/phosphodiesterase [Allosphingosinicella sp.]
MTLRFLLAGIALALAAPAAAQPAPPATPVLADPAEQRAPVVILVSIDGFRPDYLDRGLTPNLSALAASGVSGPMIPSFPSKTFPNHYTLVTGLRPDHHGIVDNEMEDARRPGVTFRIGDPKQALDSFWWNEAEPIWITAEKHGVRTATMFWPGAEVDFGGRRPSSWARFDSHITNAQRVETVMDWMRRPAAIRPHFVTLYFDNVDHAGHGHGIHSDEVSHAIADVDSHIGDLVRGLAALHQPADIVIVSDHGMADLSPDRVIRIDHMVPPSALHMVVDVSPYAAFDAAPGGRQAAEKLLGHHPHMDCWRKSGIPARLDYGRNPRVPDYLCLGEVGWIVASKDPGDRLLKGDHGYDNRAPDMRATFIAAGPDLRRGLRIPAFDNVDLYPLLARLIGIAPLANDGDATLVDEAVAPGKSGR